MFGAYSMPNLLGQNDCQWSYEIMDDAQNLSNQDQDDLAADTLEVVGVGEPVEEIIEEVEPKRSTHMKGDGNSGKEVNLPVGVKERLGRQEKRHQREMRQMKEQLAMMQDMLTNPQTNAAPQINEAYGEPNAAVDEQISKAVRAALNAQEEQKRQAHAREQQHYINSKYDDLHDNLNRASDKYDDFDDVVRAKDAPFTPAMRDAALFLDNPAEVLYKLGKNKEELKRISQLPVLEQVKEMVKLSHALMTGGSHEKSPNNARPIGQIKSYPVNPSQVNDKTSVSEIRRQMKTGEWRGRRA